jgi:hypothetical protein
MRGGVGYIEDIVNPRQLRDSHLGSIWEGTGNIVAIDALTRAVGRHGADAALAADLHARLDDSADVPQAWRDRLHGLTDRAIGFAREVAKGGGNEADARRATSLLYQVASAVAFAWEGHRIHALRGDARRMLLSRLVVDHKITMSDPFRLTENGAQRKIDDLMLGDRAASMAEVGELLDAA